MCPWCKDRAGGCPVCRSGSKVTPDDVRHATLTGGHVEPCDYVGRPVTVAGGGGRAYHLCLHPKRRELSLADVNCPCLGCGPACKGYSA